MKKDDIIARLQAANVEIPEGATVAILTDLAKDKGVSLKEAETTPENGVSETGGTTALPEGEDPLAAEKADIASTRPVPAPADISETEIAEKVRVGLTREQAIEVITNQRAHDKAIAKKA